MNNPQIIVKNAPFKRFCMSIGAIPTSYLDSLDYYETLLWLIKYLQETIIPTVNNNGEAVSELQTLYIQLKDFVENYFDNLDVQEEINNKLDEMVEDGTLQEIISSYLNANTIWCFNTIEEMKNATNLINGSYAKTFGYYSANDGGGAEYRIVNSTSQTEYQEELNNGLYANLIIKNNTINFKQLGAKPEDTNNTLYDNKVYLEKYMNIINNSNVLYELYIPSGIYGFTETNISTPKGIKIKGQKSFPQWLWTSTIFVPYNDNQDYIISFGNTNNPSYNINITDIIFSSAYYEYYSNNKSFKVQNSDPEILENNLKTIEKYAIDIIYTNYSNFENIDFRYIKGGCLNISSSWEIDINKINIRNVWNLNGNLINFDRNSTEITNSNITALTIDKIFAEAITGIVLNFSTGCTFANSKIGLINIEPNRVEFYGDINTNLSDEFTENYESVPFINFEENCIINDVNINNIQINNMCWVVTRYNNINYIYDTIIKYEKSNYFNPIINNISVVGQRKDANSLLYNSLTTSPRQNITLNNVIGNDPNYKLILNVTKIYNIIINNMFNILQNNKINISNMIPCYKLNYISPSRTFGNITYDSNSINNEKLVLNFIDTVNNPGINNIELKSLLSKCSAIYMRCKAPTGKSGNMICSISDTDGSVGSTYTGITGNDLYKWYKFDLSSLSIDFTKDITVSFYPGTTVDFEILADCIYFEQ